MLQNRTRKSREVTELKIQLAAKELFYEKGYQGSTMEAIARKSNVAKGTIYLYYNNKDDLYISLMIPGTKMINDGLRMLEDRIIGKQITTCSGIIHGIRNCFYSVYQEEPDSARIVAIFQQGGIFRKISSDILDKLNRIARSNNELVRRIIVQGKQLGVIRPEADDRCLPDVFFSVFTGVIQVEDSRTRLTQKDHLEGTLIYAFDMLAHALCFGDGL